MRGQMKWCAILCVVLFLVDKTHCRVEGNDRNKHTRDHGRSKPDDSNLIEETTAKGKTKKTEKRTSLSDAPAPEPAIIESMTGLEETSIPTPESIDEAPEIAPEATAPPPATEETEKEDVSQAKSDSAELVDPKDENNERHRPPAHVKDSLPTVEKLYTWRAQETEYGQEGQKNEENKDVVITHSEEHSRNSSKHRSSGVVVFTLFALIVVVSVAGYFGYRTWQRLQLNRYRGWRPYDVEMIELHDQWS